MCKTKSSSPINLIRFINEQANNVYGGTEATFNHADYIRHCSDAFADYFKDFLGDKYLFSTLSAWNRKKADGVFFANPDRRYYYSENVESIFKIIIEGSEANADCLLNDIPQKSISITKHILKESFGIDVFFMSETDYARPIKCNQNSHKISFFPLNKIIFYSDNEQFENNSINRQEINKLANELNMQNDPDFTYQKACRLIWYYKKMQSEYKGATGNDFVVHFIRPSFIDFDHNMLLSLATNKLLSEDELAFVDLILFKIVGLMATERVKEVETLKTKTMFSLTTHSLKTHLDTGVIKLKNAFKDKLELFPQLLDDFNELDEETEELLKLTSLLSLIDKIDDEKEFKKEAKKSKLLIESETSYNLSSHLKKFNSRHAAFPDVVVDIDVDLEKFIFSLPISEMYFSSSLLNLFFNTLFENVISHGKYDNNKVVLKIQMQSGCWAFSNETEDEIITFDPTKIKGNLRLFQLLIQETNSGTFIIENSTPHMFKIEIKAYSHE